MTTPDAVHSNRLSKATSPYLRQHASNPVDWYEWGPEALQRARQENKPIFLSIGYAACHWCHVMARESFQNAEIAALLNEHFVNIKVDREERPDLDEIYMQATLVLTDGHGGWPMSVWLTPDLKPFYAGTYFPPSSRYGRPGFRELCCAIAKAWQQRRDEITAQADKLTDVLRRELQPAAADHQPAALTLDVVDQAAELLAGAFDTVSGGLVSGACHKFPPSMTLELLMRSAVRHPAESTRRQRLIDLVTLTLDRMAAGGIYDQLGGGFHRYSTDVEWHVPHFEKMLYDQALVSRIYLDAYQLTRKPLYRRIATETLDYVLGDLQSPLGGFYSARDADSEGVEGKYYVWTRAEVLEIVGREDGELFCAHFDIRESGNWTDPHDPDTPKNVLRELRDYRCCAKLYGITPEECAARLARGRAKLLAARQKRVPPALDDKIICEWNGLMIASLARGACVLGDPRYAAAARRAATFILTHMCAGGRLHRSFCGGRTVPTAFLSDYAALIDGLIELYEATFEWRWLQQAAELNETAVALFWDAQDGGFYFTAGDHEPLIARSKEVRDSALPCGNSLQLMNLLRLAALAGSEKWRQLAQQMMTAFAPQVRTSPWSAERFLAGVDFALSGPLEIALIGSASGPDTHALLERLHATYLPSRVIALHDPQRPEQCPTAPMLDGRSSVDGRATAYVCRNQTCRPPATTPAELEAQILAALSAPTP